MSFRRLAPCRALSDLKKENALKLSFQGKQTGGNSVLN
jgi:hypothetical protein